MASYEKKTDDGTHIKVVGAGPEMPSIDGPPSNDQIHSGIKDAHGHLEKHKSHLNEHGKRIATDAQGVLNTTSALVQKKNKEERFQRLYLFTKGATKGGPSEGLVEASRSLMRQASGMGGKVSDNATDLPSYIRETVYNLATSSQFRELAVEFLNLLQSLVASTHGDLEDAKKDIRTKENPIPDKQSLRLKTRSKLAETEDDQLEAIRDRLNVFLRHVSQQKEYQDLVRNFFKYSEQMYDILYEAKDAHAETKERQDLEKLLDEAWEILGDFAGRDLVMKLKANLKKFAKETRRDDKLRAWVREEKKLILALMENPDKVDNKEINAKLREGRILTLKYRVELNRIYNESQKVIYRIRSDPTLKEFNRKLKQLGRNMVTNSEGRPDLFVIGESMSQIKDLLVESFRELLVDIPIERVEVHNDDIDLVLKDITIAGTGIVPGNAHVKMASYTDLDLDKSPDAETAFRIGLKINHIKPVFKDVHFEYEKKSFPSLKDHGVTDVIFEGDGLCAAATIAFVVKSGEVSKAKVRKSNLTLDTIKFDIDKDKTKHNIIDSMFAGRVAGRLRTKLEASMEAYMNERLKQIVGQLNDWFATKPFQTWKTKANEGLIGAQEKRQNRADRKAEEEAENIKKKQSAKLAKDKKHAEKEFKLERQRQSELERHTISNKDMQRNYPQQPMNVPAQQYFPDYHSGQHGNQASLASGETSTTSQVQPAVASVSGSSGSVLGHQEQSGMGISQATHHVDVRPGVHTDPLHTPSMSHPVGSNVIDPNFEKNQKHGQPAPGEFAQHGSIPQQ